MKSSTKRSKTLEKDASIEKSKEQDQEYVMIKMTREQAGKLVEIITKIQKSL